MCVCVCVCAWDLRIICAFPPQFEVLAVDSGRPTRTTTADVTVLVTRDEFAPEFISTPYTATITENAAINGTVLTIRATDRDLEVGARVCWCPGHQSSPSPLSVSLCGVYDLVLCCECGPKAHRFVRHQ